MFWATLYWKFKKKLNFARKLQKKKQCYQSMALWMLKSLGQVQLWGLSVRAMHFLGGSGKVLGTQGRNFAIVKNEVNR